MKPPLTLLVLLLVSLILVAGCAPAANQSQGTPGPHDRVAGFWLGIWHGFIAPLLFVVALFKTNLGIYEVHNNGAWYNLGYLFGIACFFGGGGHRASRLKT